MSAKDIPYQLGAESHVSTRMSTLNTFGTSKEDPVAQPIHEMRHPRAESLPKFGTQQIGSYRESSTGPLKDSIHGLMGGTPASGGLGGGYGTTSRFQTHYGRPLGDGFQV